MRNIIYITAFAVVLAGIYWYWKSSSAVAGATTKPRKPNYAEGLKALQEKMNKNGVKFGGFKTAVLPKSFGT
jgi:hypothetical protein